MRDLQAETRRQSITLAGLGRRWARESAAAWGQDVSKGFAAASSEMSKTFSAMRADISRFETQTQAQWAANRRPLSFALGRRMVVNAREGKAAGERFGASSGQLMGLVGRIGGAAQAAASVEQGNLAIGRSASLTTTQLATMSTQLVQVARDSNQTTQDVQKAFGRMLAGGLRFDAVAGSIGSVSRAAKATYVDINAMATLAQSLQTALAVSPSGLQQALGSIAVASDKGTVKMAQMTALLPGLAAGFQRVGLSGNEGVASMAAALQVARGGASSDKQAAGNTQAFLDDLVSPQVAQRASATLGLNLADVMRQAQSSGGNPFDAAIRGILQATAGDLSKLDAVFQNSGSRAFLRSMTVDWARYGDVRRQALVQGDGAIDAKFGDASQALGFKLERLGNSFERLKQVFGKAMGPAVGKVADGLSGLLDTATGFVEKNPQLVAGATSAGVAFAALGTVVSGAQWAFRLAQAPVLQVMGFLQRWQGGQAVLQMGRLGSAALRVGGALRWVAMAIGGIGGAPLLAIAAALAAAAIGVSLLWNGIKEMFNGIGAGISDSMQPALSLLSETLSELQPAWDLMGTSLEWLKEKFVTLVGPINFSAESMGVFHAVGHAIGQMLTFTMRIAIGLVSAALHKITTLGKSIAVLGVYATEGWKAGEFARKDLQREDDEWTEKFKASVMPPNPAAAIEAGRNRARQIKAGQDKAKEAPAQAAVGIAGLGLEGMPLGALGADFDLAALQGKAPPALSLAAGKAGSAPAPATMVNTWNITQLAGESAEALARRVIAMLEREQAVRQRSSLADGVYN